MKKLLWLICAMWISGANAAEQPISTFTLKNGMEVIVIENHRVPAVSHMLWFFVGAADDPVGKSGLAHYHEHMMFKGSAHYKAGEYDDIIARNGGKQNAFTSRDTTAYYIEISKDMLPLAMTLEADRLRKLTPSDADALKERDVIIEERRSRIENRPASLLLEQMTAALFQHHPYRIPIIGWKHEMETLTKQDVLEFHNRYYHPGNAVLIISGDTTAKEVQALAEKYYANIPAGPKITREWRKEPPQIAPRRVTLHHKEVKQADWQRNYLAPSAIYGDTKQAVPMLILEHILGEGQTSRLYQALVTKQKLAAAVDADYNPFTMGPGTFSVSATPASGIALEKMEAAVDAEIARIIKDGITDEELARSKTLLKASTIYEREGLQSMGRVMGWIRMIGLSVDYFSKYPSLIDAVTKEQVQEAAKATLNLNQSVTGILVPEGGAHAH